MAAAVTPILVVYFFPVMSTKAKQDGDPATLGNYDGYHVAKVILALLPLPLVQLDVGVGEGSAWFVVVPGP